MPRPPKSPLAICACLAVSVALASGCGYRSTLGPRESKPLSATGSADRKVVAEPVRISLTALRSDSPEPWLDRIVTDALRRELGNRATLRLVDDPDAAAMAVHGRIRPLDVNSRSFSSFVAALEYSVTLALDLDVRLENGTVLKLDPAMLSETESYLASPDIEVTRTNRLEALRRISDQLASRVADSLELLDRPMPGQAPPPATSPKTDDAAKAGAGG